MMSDADAKRQSMVAGPNAAEKPVWHRQLALECLFNYFLQPEISDQLLNLYRMCYGSEPPLPLTPAKEATPEVQAGVESELSGDSGAVASQEANEEGSASMSRASATAALTDNVVERLMMSIESNIVAASTGSHLSSSGQGGVQQQQRRGRGKNDRSWGKGTGTCGGENNSVVCQGCRGSCDDCRDERIILSGGEITFFFF